MTGPEKTCGLSDDRDSSSGDRTTVAAVIIKGKRRDRWLMSDLPYRPPMPYKNPCTEENWGPSARIYCRRRPRKYWWGEGVGLLKLRVNGRGPIRAYFKEER